MTATSISSTIAAMGTALGPEVLMQCRALFEPEQAALAAAVPVTHAELAYGPHARHRLDVYLPGTPVQDAPVLVFVHGGGFLKGDKGGADAWPNANVGRMAARVGFVGVVINYRLAPDDVWPSGAQDIAAVVTWLGQNAAPYGGHPGRIVLAGTSAGAVHVAGYLKLAGDAAIRGAVLLSGLYGYTPLDERDMLYYGDETLYAGRMPMAAVAATRLPLLLACAQYDPPRFQAEFLGLMHDRLARHGSMPRAAIVSGHNHYSMPMHLGTSDDRLAREICAFVRDVTQ